MDDMNAFERQVAGESGWLLGRERPVDDAAIFAAVASADCPQAEVRTHVQCSQARGW